MPDNAVEAVGISKRFRFPMNGRPATLKDVVLRRIQFEGHYGVVDALCDVTFSVGRGQTLGVIGANASGKTTFLRILSGVTNADSGTVKLQGSCAPLLALGTGFNPEFTGRENALVELLCLGLSRRQALDQLDQVIEFSELADFIDAPVRTYSDGMAMRLAFAAAIRVDPDILLIDEVLAVGDERFAAKCIAWLESFKRRGKTTILVTHDSLTVASLCDVALWLDNGRVAAFGERMDVIRAYAGANNGKPVAATVVPDRVQSLESATAAAENYRVRIASILPLLRLPLVGYVRQTGKIKGGYEDGWTDGALEFTIEPLREVRSWVVQATVPAGMPQGSTVAVEVDGNFVTSARAAGGKIALHCNKPLPKGRSTKVRITSSATVNHRDLGISGDLRDVGARIDEIVFDH